jgi:hypothetical protein
MVYNIGVRLDKEIQMIKIHLIRITDNKKTGCGLRVTSWDTRDLTKVNCEVCKKYGERHNEYKK